MESSHYRRIHARVSRRLWSDLDTDIRDIIANDPLHLTEAYKWFETKVKADATRLYEDSSYYDNLKETFDHSQYSDLVSQKSVRR